MKSPALSYNRCWFWLFLWGIGLGFPSHAQALSLVWQSPPTQLVRGRHFLWQGQIKGISSALLQKGVRISFALLLPSRTIRLGQAPVNNSGQFLFQGVVSHQLLPQSYQLDVRILVPQQTPSPTSIAPVSKTQERLFQDLKKGWKTEDRATQTRSWFLPQKTKSTAFLLPPIQPDADARKSDSQAPTGRSKDIGASRLLTEPKGTTKPPANRSSFQEQHGDRRKIEPSENRAMQGQTEKHRNSHKPTTTIPGRRPPSPSESPSESPPTDSHPNPSGSASIRRPPSSRSGYPDPKQGRMPTAEQPPPPQPPPPQELPPTMVPPVSSTPKYQPRKKPLHSNRDSLVWSRSSASNLDLDTDMGHTYLRQVFDPYIPHLQRISVLQQVRSDFSLTQVRGPKVLLRVGGQKQRNRAYFVGRIRVVLWRKRWTPIPSVSPEARILWYRTRPRVVLEFAKDTNDLFYVRAKRWNTALVSLEFGTDGSRDYFGGDIAQNIRSSQYRATLRPRVPFRVRRIVLRHLHQFGLKPYAPLHEILFRIVPYLRSFVARKLQPRENRSNVFSTLWLSRVGVCRHRATLFVMALQSLGFPARMVANQAHAFAEVQYPNRQWRQIDLGGGEIPHWMGAWRGRRFPKPHDPFPTPPPNPHQATKPHTTPHPPPHDPSQDPTKLPTGSVGVAQNNGLQGAANPSGHPSQATSSPRGRPTPVPIRRVRKIRKPYLPHTRF